MTFWREGFSVEDGDLMRYDDPNNEQILAEINAGFVSDILFPSKFINVPTLYRRAPPSILNVQPGQPVELRVAKRLSEPYQPAPKRPVGSFGGSGHRLGSPVPNVASAGSSAGSAMPGTFPSSGVTTAGAASVEPQSINTRFEVDQTKPTTSVQVRLADGTRYVTI